MAADRISAEPPTTERLYMSPGTVSYQRQQDTGFPPSDAIIRFPSQAPMEKFSVWFQSYYMPEISVNSGSGWILALQSDPSSRNCISAILPEMMK